MREVGNRSMWSTRGLRPCNGILSHMNNRMKCRGPSIVINRNDCATNSKGQRAWSVVAHTICQSVSLHFSNHLNYQPSNYFNWSIVSSCESAEFAIVPLLLSIVNSVVRTISWPALTDSHLGIKPPSGQASRPPGLPRLDPASRPIFITVYHSARQDLISRP